MSEPNFEEGDAFETPNGRAVITDIYSHNDPIKYTLEYQEVAGQLKSPLAENELENNENITQLDE